MTSAGLLPKSPKLASSMPVPRKPTKNGNITPLRGHIKMANRQRDADADASESEHNPRTPADVCRSRAKPSRVGDAREGDGGSDVSLASVRAAGTTRADLVRGEIIGQAGAELRRACGRAQKSKRDQSGTDITTPAECTWQGRAEQA